MYNLSSLLEKFKHLKNPREEKERLVSTLSLVVGFEVDYGAVEVRNTIIYLNTTPYIKTECFIKKDQILNELKVKGFNITDIR